MAVIGKKSFGSKTFDTINVLLLSFLTFIFLYPMWHVLMASFSDGTKLMQHSGALLWPTGYSLKGYEAVFRNKNILTGYKNTLFYVVAGTGLNMVMTCIGAYVMSQKKFMFRNFITVMAVLTMYFNGGLIPTFLNVRQLGLYNTRWAIIVPSAIATWNLIVMRTAFSRIPNSLQESATIDGANDMVILFRIIIPVAKATIAVIALFYAVGHWNSWFSAMIYLQDRGKYPLQLFLREILIANTISTSSGEGFTSADGVYYLEELIKYCTIIIATVPILFVYPFVQRYFVKGIMLGSLKG